MVSGWLSSQTAGRPVLQLQLRQTGPGRWLGFGPAAVNAGVEAFFVYPLLVGGTSSGVADADRMTAGVRTPT